jgi:DNA-binding beta-propeller fold protein YncE
MIGRAAGRTMAGPMAALALLGTAMAPNADGGSLRWAVPFAPGGTPYGIATSPDGSRVFVTGCNGSAAGCSNKYETVAHDSQTGSVLWSQEYAGYRPEADTAFAIGVSLDGSLVYVTGTSDGADIATLAYDAITGALVWEARYPAVGYPCCLEVSADGSRLYVAGRNLRNNQFYVVVVVGYDAATGAQVWEAEDPGSDLPSGLGISPDGSLVFVTGEATGPDLYNDYSTAAFDATTADRVWEAVFNDPDKYGDTPYRLAVNPDGSAVYVTGCLGDFDYCVQSDIGTVAYDAATGTELWVAIYDGPVHGVDSGGDLEASPDGTVLYVSGTSDQITSPDFITVAYDTATGAQVWVGTYDGPTNETDYGCCMDLSPDGTTVAMTGVSLRLGIPQLATVEFDASTGAILWAARNKGGHQGYNDPTDIAFSRDGRGIYVTESTVSHSGHYDFYTLAYRA